MKGKCKYMSSKLHYKGYTAEIYYSAEDNLIFGKLEGIKDLVNFHSDNTGDIVQHFHNAVDDYLELCAEIDKEPEKPNKIDITNGQLTTKECIDILQEEWDFAQQPSYVQAAIEGAILALEAQIPEKPVYRGSINGIIPLRCPSCNAELNEECRCCSNCGQRLEWE
jgi:predicted HicB family RNase H-like nuclease